MKKIISFLVLFSMFHVHGQVKKVTLQASGLTCSMCSNSINKALKTIDYVDKVMANIQQSSFDISFKPGATVNFDDLKRKVEDAGFTVANLSAAVDFNQVAISNDEHIQMEGMLFHFINVKAGTLTGIQHIQVVDKGFVSSKVYRKYSGLTKMECFKTGVAGSCCTKAGIAAGTRIYHVTI